MPDFRREDSRIEEKDQSKSRVLDTRFYRQGSDIVFRQSCQSTAKVSGSQRSPIVKCDDEEYVEDIVNEYLEILYERFTAKLTRW